MLKQKRANNPIKSKQAFLTEFGIMFRLEAVDNPAAERLFKTANF
jgi:hypothetical protein